jgi:hypothetical protein
MLACESTPIPAVPNSHCSVKCFDDQRETVLLKSEGLSAEQVIQKLPPSDLTLGGSQHMPVAPGHHLLPHEHWFASLILERQRTHRTPAILRMEQNYGSDEIALWAAGRITVFPGMLLGFLGFACLAAIPGSWSTGCTESASP